MHGLEHIGQRILGRRRAETFGGLGDAGRFMPQRLHQPQHAVFACRGTQQHRADQAFAQFAGEIVEHRVARRLDVFQQLLHQHVVVIGELFQHREARFLLAVEIAAVQRDHFGRLVLAIDKGALQREIDETLDQFAVPDRNLAQHQRHARGRLQRRQRFADPLVGLVDLVQKQKARNAHFLELAQDDLQLRQLLFIRLADHDRGIDRRQRGAHVLRELDRAGTIDKGVAVAHESGGGGTQADAHLVVPRLGAGIADRSSGIDAAGFVDGACARQYGFKKCGFTALERAHQRNAPWTSCTGGLLTSCPIAASLFGARPMIGSADQMLRPSATIWQVRKSRCGACVGASDRGRVDHDPQRRCKTWYIDPCRPRPVAGRHPAERQP